MDQLEHLGDKPNENTIEFIKHYGVVGMHWGVRSSRTPRRQTSESRKVSELSKRKPHELTNKQLKTINERKNLEQNFKRLNPSTMKKGRVAATEILAVAGLIGGISKLAQTPAGKASIAQGSKYARNLVSKLSSSKTAWNVATLGRYA